MYANRVAVVYSHFLPVLRYHIGNTQIILPELESKGNIEFVLHQLGTERRHLLSLFTFTAWPPHSSNDLTTPNYYTHVKLCTLSLVLREYQGRGVVIVYTYLNLLTLLVLRQWRGRSVLIAYTYTVMYFITSAHKNNDAGVYTVIAYTHVKITTAQEVTRHWCTNS